MCNLNTNLEIVELLSTIYYIMSGINFTFGNFSQDDVERISAGVPETEISAGMLYEEPFPFSVENLGERFSSLRGEGEEDRLNFVVDEISGEEENEESNSTVGNFSPEGTGWVPEDTETAISGGRERVARERREREKREEKERENPEYYKYKGLK